MRKIKWFLVVMVLLSLSIVLGGCSSDGKKAQNIISYEQATTGIFVTNKLTLDDIKKKYMDARVQDNWKVVEKKPYDIDNDGKEDSIVLYWLQDGNSIPKLKVAINDMEKVIELDPSKVIPVNNVKIKQFVRLDNNNKGILIKLNSEGESENQDYENAPPYWFDHSFLILGYGNGDIVTILDGVNQPFNKTDNYSVKYLDNYYIEFHDNATGFNAKYVATLYKSADDGEKRLKTINDYPTSGISGNYFNVKIQDVNSDGVDEVICSKYIPGLYHADLLGIIEYTFALKNGKHQLSKELLKYDGESGLSIVQQMEIK